MLYFHTSAQRGISTARGRTISTLKWKNPRRIELDVATLLFSHTYAEFLLVFDEKHIGLVAVFPSEAFASQIAELPGREGPIKNNRILRMLAGENPRKPGSSTCNRFESASIAPLPHFAVRVFLETYPPT